jgi:hypothetical protein
MAKPFPFDTPAGRQLIKRGLTEFVTDWVIGHKGGRTPANSGVGGELGARAARLWFPNMYNAYLTSGHWVRANLLVKSGGAMERTYRLLAKHAAIDRWNLKRWVIGGKHFACLTYPGADWQKRFDQERTKYGHKPSSDPYRNAWVFDPWVEKKDGIYRLDTWRRYLAGDGPYLDREAAPWTPLEYSSTHLMERATLP